MTHFTKWGNSNNGSNFLSRVKTHFPHILPDQWVYIIHKQHQSSLDTSNWFCIYIVEHKQNMLSEPDEILLFGFDGECCLAQQPKIPNRCSVNLLNAGTIALCIIQILFIFIKPSVKEWGHPTRKHYYQDRNVTQNILNSITQSIYAGGV